MLERSFIFLPRIGTGTERRLWREGIANWDDFLKADRVKGLSAERKTEADGIIIDMKATLERGDVAPLTDALPPSEHWRAYRRFRDDSVFLDIETMGLSRWTTVTVVGLWDGKEDMTLVLGRDLSEAELAKRLSQCKMIVTYNGRGFDVPILQNHYPSAIPRVPHVDLRIVGHRLGYKGGLKRLERELGLERDQRVQGMAGEDAVRLWNLWKRKGDRRALDLLLQYNREDVRNLRTIAGNLVDRLAKQTLESADALTDNPQP